METIADRYRRLRNAFAAKAECVPPRRWEHPSPCEQWTSRDVVGHIVEPQQMFEGLVGRTLQPGPALADDPAGAFWAATDQVQAHLDDPEAAAAEFDGAFGRTTFADAVEQFLCFDLVVHGWDLSRATGLDERIDPVDVSSVRARAEELGDMLRSPNVCGPEVPIPADSTDQDKLLAFLGRKP